MTTITTNKKLTKYDSDCRVSNFTDSITSPMDNDDHVD